MWGAADNALSKVEVSGLLPRLCGEHIAEESLSFEEEASESGSDTSEEDEEGLRERLGELKETVEELERELCLNSELAVALVKTFDEDAAKALALKGRAGRVPAAMKLSTGRLSELETRLQQGLSQGPSGDFGRVPETALTVKPAGAGAAKGSAACLVS